MQVGNLELNLLLNRTSFDRTLREAERDARMFKNQKFEVSPTVDTSGLKDIRDEVRYEVNYLNQWLKLNPIKPQVDLSQLQKVHDLMATSGGTIRVEAEVKDGRGQGGDDCCDDITRSISSNTAPIRDLLKEIAGNTRKRGLISRTVGTFAEGSILGVTQAATRNFGEGISKGLERYFKTDFGRRGQALGLGTGRNVRRAGNITDVASRELLGMPNGLKDVKRLLAGNTQAIYNHLSDPQFYKDLEELYVEMARQGFEPSDLLGKMGELEKNPRIKAELDKFGDRFEKYIEDYVARGLGAAIRLGTQPLRIRKRIGLEDSAKTALETAEVYAQKYSSPEEKERIAQTDGTIYVIGGGQPAQSKPGEPNVQSTYDLANQVATVFPDAYVKTSAPVNANSLETLESSPSIQLKNFILENQETAKEMLSNLLPKEDVEQLLASLKNPHPFDRMTQTNIQGFDEDAIKTAAEVIGEIRQNIVDGVARDITIIGGSLGGHVVENVIGILNHAAKLEPELAPHIARVRGEGQGTPITGYTATAHTETGEAKFHSTIGDQDHVGVAYYGENFINPNTSEANRQRILEEVPFGLPNEVVFPHPEMQTVIPEFGFLHKVGKMTPKLGSKSHESGRNFIDFINSRDGSQTALLRQASADASEAFKGIKQAGNTEDISNQIEQIVFALSQFNLDAGSLYQYKDKQSIPSEVVSQLEKELAELQAAFDHLTGIGKSTSEAGLRATAFHGTFNHTSSAIAQIAQGKSPEGIYSPIDSELMDLEKLKAAANSSPEQISLYGGEPEALMQLWKDTKANIFRAMGEEFNEEWNTLVSIFDRMAQSGYEERFNAKPFQQIVGEPSGQGEAKVKIPVEDRFSREDISPDEVFPRIADFLHKTTGIDKDDDLPTILKKSESADLGDSEIDKLARQALDTFIAMKKKEAQYYIDYAKRMVGFKEALAKNPQDEGALRGMISEMVESPFSHFALQLRTSSSIAKIPEGISPQDYLFDYLSGKPVEPMNPNIANKTKKQIGDVDIDAATNFISQSLFTSLVAQVHGLEAAVEMARQIFERFGDATKDSRMAKQQILGMGLEPSLESNPFAIRSLLKLKKLAQEKGLDFADFEINQAKVLGKGYTGEAIELQDKGLVVKRSVTDFATENDKIGNKTEIAAMNAIADKNIAPKPIGKVDDMFVMTAVPGKTLRSQLDDFDTNKIDDLLKRVGAILATIHESGYAHNDFNTANILYDQESDRLSVIDFPNATEIKGQSDIDADFSTAIERSTKGASEYVAKNFEKLVTKGYQMANEIVINPETVVTSDEKYKPPTMPVINGLNRKQQQAAQNRAREIWESKGSPQQNRIDERIDTAQAILETLSGSFDPVKTDEIAKKIWESKGSKSNSYQEQRTDYLEAIQQQINSITPDPSKAKKVDKPTVEESKEQIYQRLESLLDSIASQAVSSPELEDLGNIIATAMSALDPYTNSRITPKKAQDDSGKFKYTRESWATEANPFLTREDSTFEDETINNESLLPSLHVSTNEKLDTVISLLSGTSMREAIPMPDLAQPEMELVTVGDSPEETQRGGAIAVVEETETRMQKAGEILKNAAAATIDIFAKGAINGTSRVFEYLQNVEDEKLGKWGKRAKGAIQATALGVGATHVPGIHEAIGLINEAARMGANSEAHALAQALIDQLSSDVPGVVKDAVESLTNISFGGVGDMVSVIRDAPEKFVDAIMTSISNKVSNDVMTTGEVIAAGAGTKAVINTGLDGLKRHANPEFDAEEGRKAIAKSEEALKRADFTLNGDVEAKQEAEDLWLDGEVAAIKIQQLGEAAKHTAETLNEVFTVQGLRRLAVKADLESTDVIDGSSRTIGNARAKDNLAQHIVDNASQEQIEKAVNAMPKGKHLYRSGYKDRGADKPQMGENVQKIFKDIHSRLRREVEELDFNLNIEQAADKVKAAKENIQKVKLEYDLDPNMAKAIGGLKSSQDINNIDLAIQAYQKFGDINELIAKINADIGESAINADRHWGNTTADILKNFTTLAAEAKSKGYDIQKAISEGSPGTTQRIREHWGKTTSYLITSISDIKSKAEISGSSINKAMAANPKLAGDLEQLKWIIKDLQSVEPIFDTGKIDLELEDKAVVDINKSLEEVQSFLEKLSDDSIVIKPLLDTDELKKSESLLSKELIGQLGNSNLEETKQEQNIREAYQKTRAKNRTDGAKAKNLEERKWKNNQTDEDATEAKRAKRKARKAKSEAIDKEREERKSKSETEAKNFEKEHNVKSERLQILLGKESFNEAENEEFKQLKSFFSSLFQTDQEKKLAGEDISKYGGINKKLYKQAIAHRPNLQTKLSPSIEIDPPNENIIDQNKLEDIAKDAVDSANIEPPVLEVPAPILETPELPTSPDIKSAPLSTPDIEISPDIEFDDLEDPLLEPEELESIVEDAVDSANIEPPVVEVPAPILEIPELPTLPDVELPQTPPPSDFGERAAALRESLSQDIQQSRENLRQVNEQLESVTSLSEGGSGGGKPPKPPKVTTTPPEEPEEPEDSSEDGDQPEKKSQELNKKIRRHWKKTTLEIQERIKRVKEESKKAGSDINESFAANPQLKEDFEKLEQKINGFSRILDTDYQLEVAASADGIEDAVNESLEAVDLDLGDIEAGAAFSVDAEEAIAGFEALGEALAHIHGTSVDTQHLWQQIVQIATGFASNLGEGEDDPLGGLENVYDGYSDAVNRLPNIGDIFGGVSEFIDEMSEASPVFGNIVGFVKELGISAVGLLGFSELSDNMTDMFYELVEYGREFQRFERSMSAAGKTGMDVFNDLYETSQKYGTSLIESMAGYQQLALSTQGTDKEAVVDSIFPGFQKAFASRQATPEQQGRGFLAVEQMLSKGNASAEELRQQLSEALPGAFAIAAQSMGMDMQEFTIRLYSAQIASEELLTRMAAFYDVDSQILLQISSESFEAELNRITNNLDYVKSVAGDIIIPFLTPALKLANTVLTTTGKLAEGLIVIFGSILAGSVWRWFKALKAVGGALKVNVILTKFLGMESIGNTIMLMRSMTVLQRGMLLTQVGIAKVAAAAKAMWAAFAAPTAVMAGLYLAFKLFTAGAEEVKAAAKVAKQLAKDEQKDSDPKNYSRSFQSNNLLKRPVDRYAGYFNQAKEDPLGALVSLGKDASVFGFIDDVGSKIEIGKISESIKYSKQLSESLSAGVSNSEFNDIKDRLEENRGQQGLLNAQRRVAIGDSDYEGLKSIELARQQLKKEQEELLKPISEKLSYANKDLEQLETQRKNLNDNFDRSNITQDRYEKLKAEIEVRIEAQLANKKTYEEMLAGVTTNIDADFANLQEGFANAVWTIDGTLSQGTLDTINAQLEGEMSSVQAEVDLSFKETTRAISFAGIAQELADEQRNLILNEPTMLKRNALVDLEIIDIADYSDPEIDYDFDKIFEEKLSDVLNQDPDAFIKAVSEDASVTEVEAAKFLASLGDYSKAADDAVVAQKDAAAATKDHRTQLKDTASEYRDLGTSLRDFARGQEDFQLERQRFLEDFPLQVEQVNRDLERSARDLAEQYDDFIMSLDQQIIQTQLEILALEKELKNTRLRNDFTSALSGTEGFGRELAELYLQYAEGVQSDEEIQLQLNLDKLSIEEQVLQNARQIRDIAEQRRDFEIDRLNQIRDLNRQQEDFTRQQKRTWADNLEQWYQIGLQSQKLGIALDKTGAEITSQGNGLIESIHFLSESIIAKATELRDNVNIDAQTPSIVNALRRAIIGKESGGNFKAINRDPEKKGLQPAYGYGQVLGNNIPSWTKQALGKSLSVDEYLNNPKAQIKTINHKLNEYYEKELAKTNGDRELAIRRTASTWYSGNPDLYQHQGSEKIVGSSASYPTIDAYTKDILKRTKEQLDNPIATPPIKTPKAAEYKEIEVTAILAPELHKWTPLTSKYGSIADKEKEATQKTQTQKELLDEKYNLQKQLTPEQKEQQRLDFIDQFEQKKRQIDEYFLDRQRQTEALKYEAEKNAANAKGYLTLDEEVDFTGRDVAKDYQDRIYDFESQIKELELVKEGAEAALKLWDTEELKNNEAAQAIVQAQNEIIAQTQTGITDLEKIKASVEVEIDPAIDVAKTNKRLELEFERRADELGLRSQLLESRQSFAPSFIHDRLNDKEARSVGEAEIKLDYERELKELDKFKGEFGEITFKYLEMKEALEELNQVKLDALYAETNSLVQLFDEVAQPALNGLLDDFINTSVTASEAWRNFAQSILNSLTDILMAYAKNEVLKMLFKNEGNGILGGNDSNSPGVLTDVINTGVGVAVNSLTQPKQGATVANPQGGGGFWENAIALAGQTAVAFLSDGGDTETMAIPYASHGLDTSDIALAKGLNEAIRKEAHPEAFPAVLHKGEVVLTDLNGDAQFAREKMASGEWNEMKNQTYQPMKVDNYRDGSHTSATAKGRGGGDTIVYNSPITVHAKDADSFRPTEDQIYYRQQLRMKRSQR